MKLVYSLLLLFPIAVAAQLPIPITPDWLKPSQTSAELLQSTHVILTENNFRIVATNLVGKSRGFKLLGLITFKSTSHTRAMSRLVEKAHVEIGHPQALANVIHESSSMYLILFSIPKVTIRADLIEFNDARPNVGTNGPMSLRVRGQPVER